MRSIRRHHLQRMKARGRSILHQWNIDHDEMLIDYDQWAIRWINLYARTRKRCSCCGCGNPRKWQKRLTRREYEQMQELREYTGQEL